MPEAVGTWVEGHDARETRRVQRSILATYILAMGKHAATDVERIRLVWESIPVQLARENKKFMFKDLKKGGRLSEFDKAIQWLVDAGLVYRIARVTKPEEPLKFYADESAFKVYMLDQGLLACMAGTRSREMLIGMGAFVEFKGSFTENFVLSQLKSLELHDQMDKNIFYYSKDNSSMEVDFVVQCRDRVVPAEVKAEENVRSKSLRHFITEEFRHLPLTGLRLSMKPYADQGWKLNILLFLAEAYFKREGLGGDDEV